MGEGRENSVLSILRARQLCGVRYSAIAAQQLRGKSRIGVGRRRPDRIVVPNELSGASAWNRRRLQNMILVAGPDASAATSDPVFSSSSSSDQSSPRERNRDDPHHHNHHHDDDESAPDSEDGSDGEQQNERIRGVDELATTSGARRVLSSGAARTSHDEEGKDDDSDNDSDSMFDGSLFYRAARRTTPTMQPTVSPTLTLSAMTHDGCINTAAWLDCSWRLSLARTMDDDGPGYGFIHSSSHSSNSAANARAVPSHECPTQLLTSGDDQLVKFWDVSGAMGSTSPLPNRPSTTIPFSSPATNGESQHRDSHGKRGASSLGTVVPLAFVETGHRGNIFHATPIPSRPGKVATCAADGNLRLIDVELQSTSSSSVTASSIIVSAEYDNDNGRHALDYNIYAGIFFSHHFLDSNTGLLCFERGIRRFDLRLPPRSQPTCSILGASNRPSKTCAIWSASSSHAGDGDVDSAYVFAGGSSSDVALYDMRMTSDITSRTVQIYCPSTLSCNESVSVSGLDISRDKKELLVSYENDQIYTFPIFPGAASAVPNIEELTAYSSAVAEESSALSELASYGGHLNRYTFLKSAKYAGPSDEYICTGSDSGHAWIYEKATGAVASLLLADHSTCNGIVPHPTLPYFVTYGIDSTASLWRATLPVDCDVDDSDMGRSASCLREPYLKSPLVRDWKGVQDNLNTVRDVDVETMFFLPDEMSLKGDKNGSILLPRFARSFWQSDRLRAHLSDSPFVCNDLRNLPKVLRQNYDECVRAVRKGFDQPIRSGLDGLKRRMSLIRLYHQADQLGLICDPSIPWKMCPKTHHRLRNDDKKSDSPTMNATCHGHPADLVPNYPSDWIPYHVATRGESKPFGMNFNADKYPDFFPERRHSAQQPKCLDDAEASVTRDECTPDVVDLWSVLLEQVVVLKEGGNAALQEGAIALAARRYDKALQYCAVAFMEFPVGNHEFLRSSHNDNDNNNAIIASEHGFRWTPLLKSMIAVRLNLSLVMTKPEILDLTGAKDQANTALAELKPFTKGQVNGSIKNPDLVRGNDSDEPTYLEAKEFQAKAYYRLGTAQFASGDFSCAVRSFECSIECTKHVRPDSKKSDNMVERRLVEARREQLKRKKRHRQNQVHGFLRGRK